MAAILTSIHNTVIAGAVLALVVLLIYMGNGGSLDMNFWTFFFRWLHVLSGVMWVGLLYYFNFVQIPNMPNIPDDQKPAIGKVIAPAALFWFRWGAMSTIITGLLLATMIGYLGDALTLGAMNGFTAPRSMMIGMGMWMGIIMWFNVWFIIWPNQQKALNIDGKFPDLAADAKAAAGRTAMLFSRTNTMLSIPMLFCMVAAQNI
jgi:uncharacterized membrane protein